MSEEINLGHIFGYDKLIKVEGEFVALRGEGQPELYKGKKVVLLGDTQGYVPANFRPNEEVTISGFREPDKAGSTDHIY
jgi:hypothetical protein